MTKGLHRYYGNNDLHFITCSCYHRQPQLDTPERRDLFLSILEEARQKYRFVVHGYVIMPEHFHLLMTEPDLGDPSVVMKVLKERFTRKLRTKKRTEGGTNNETEGAPLIASFAMSGIPNPEPVWQKRFYDFNVRTEEKHIEKLRYITLLMEEFEHGVVRLEMTDPRRDWALAASATAAKSVDEHGMES
jgi:putative transposase